jgi:hypothetical protein
MMVSFFKKLHFDDLYLYLHAAGLVGASSELALPFSFSRRMKKGTPIPPDSIA